MIYYIYLKCLVEIKFKVVRLKQFINESLRKNVLDLCPNHNQLIYFINF